MNFVPITNYSVEDLREGCRVYATIPGPWKIKAIVEIQNVEIINGVKKYYIHFCGLDVSQDEWVTASRFDLTQPMQVPRHQTCPDTPKGILTPRRTVKRRLFTTTTPTMKRKPALTLSEPSKLSSGSWRMKYRNYLSRFPGGVLGPLRFNRSLRPSRRSEIWSEWESLNEIRTQALEDKPPRLERMDRMAPNPAAVVDVPPILEPTIMITKPHHVEAMIIGEEDYDNTAINIDSAETGAVYNVTPIIKPPGRIIVGTIDLETEDVYVVTPIVKPPDNIIIGLPDININGSRDDNIIGSTDTNIIGSPTMNMDAVDAVTPAVDASLDVDPSLPGSGILEQDLYMSDSLCVEERPDSPESSEDEEADLSDDSFEQWIDYDEIGHFSPSPPRVDAGSEGSNTSENSSECVIIDEVLNRYRTQGTPPRTDSNPSDDEVSYMSDDELEQYIDYEEIGHFSPSPSRVDTESDGSNSSKNSLECIPNDEIALERFCTPAMTSPSDDEDSSSHGSFETVSDYDEIGSRSPSPPRVYALSDDSNISGDSSECIAIEEVLNRYRTLQGTPPREVEESVSSADSYDSDINLDKVQHFTFTPLLRGVDQSEKSNMSENTYEADITLDEMRLGRYKTPPPTHCLEVDSDEDSDSLEETYETLDEVNLSSFLTARNAEPQKEESNMPENAYEANVTLDKMGLNRYRTTPRAPTREDDNKKESDNSEKGLWELIDEILHETSPTPNDEPKSEESKASETLTFYRASLNTPTREDVNNEEFVTSDEMWNETLDEFTLNDFLTPTPMVEPRSEESNASENPYEAYITLDEMGLDRYKTPPPTPIREDGMSEDSDSSDETWEAADEVTLGRFHTCPKAETKIEESKVSENPYEAYITLDEMGLDRYKTPPTTPMRDDDKSENSDSSDETYETLDEVNLSSFQTTRNDRPKSGESEVAENPYEAYTTLNEMGRNRYRTPTRTPNREVTNDEEFNSLDETYETLDEVNLSSFLTAPIAQPQSEESIVAVNPYEAYITLDEMGLDRYKTPPPTPPRKPRKNPRVRGSK